jgi:hypothetical protein
VCVCCRGRGVWRCVYDPHSALLITAGADASIKVQSLAKWAHLPPNFQESGEEAKTDQRQNSPHAVDFHMSLARANWVTGGEYQPMYIDRYIFLPLAFFYYLSVCSLELFGFTARESDELMKLCVMGIAFKARVSLLTGC